VVRKIGAGVPVLCCPAVGDMTENGARVAWAGTGLMLPWRLTRVAPIRAAVRRTLGDPKFQGQAAEIAAWTVRNHGAQRATALVERLAEV